MTRIGSLCDDTQCAGVARVPPTPDSQPESSEHDSVVRARESGVTILCIRRPSNNNTNTSKSEMINKNNYEVDFRRHKSINDLLGYHSKLYTWGFNESENIVNILTINSILIF